MSNTTVYLEDIQTKKEKKEEKPVVVTTTGKRQLTLLEFSGPAAKRAKTAVSTAVDAAPTRQTLNALPFSLSAFVASLPEEHKELLALECECLGKSWFKVLAPNLTKPSFLALKRYLRDQGVRGANDSQVGRVFPPARDIYAWSSTPLGRVKVVILGQDPYPRAGQAHGFAFSVQPGVSVPASLQNIYKELQSEYPDFTPPAHGTLTPWASASSGVLLLNTVLTVAPNTPGSHANRGWEAFTEGVLRAVDKWGGANLPGSEGRGRGVVVMAWGSHAKQRVAWMDTTKHLVLTSAHPSPKSADRGFFGNGHFKKANEWLEERYGPGAAVVWTRID